MFARKRSLERIENARRWKLKNWIFFDFSLIDFFLALIAGPVWDSAEESNCSLNTKASN